MSTAPIILPTGPPQIIYTEATPSGPQDVTLTLPVPDFSRHVSGSFADESVYLRRLSGLERRGGALRQREQFAFGYRMGHLSDAEIRTLAEAASQRIVRLVPRTLAAGDPAGAAAQVRTVACRVRSDLPITRHLTLGYDIVLSLEALAP